jgi:hypothetical protein
MPLCAAILVSLLAMVPSAALAADDAEQLFFKAYYLEVEEGKVDAALQVYQEVEESPQASAELKERAKKRMAGLREDQKARDLTRLLPGDALVTLEVRKPGERLGEIIKMMGFAGGSPAGKGGEGDERGGEFAISPKMVEGLKGLEGAALAITAIDLERGIPQGVAIVNLGRSPAIGGLIETALSAAAESGVLRPGEQVSGHSAYTGPFGTVVLTERLLIAGSPHDLAVAAVKRIEGGELAPLGAGEALAELKAEREDSLLFAQVDARKIVSLLKGALGRGRETPEELQIAQALFDLDSLQWAALGIKTGERSLRGDLWLKLAEENHCLAYHLLRSPALDRAALRSVPPGAAAVLAIALSGPAGDGEPSPRARAEAARTITGLDLGREIFSNVRTVLAFASPPSPPGGDGDGPPIPQVGVELLVKDPARSSLLWSEVLRVLAIVIRADAQPVRTQSIAGRDVSTFSFPDGVQIALAALPDRVILTLGEPAMAAALRTAAGPAQEDGDLASMLGSLSGQESKLFLMNGARMVELVRPLGGFRGRDGDRMASFLEKSALIFATTETPSRLQISSSVKVPELAPLIRQLMHGGQAHVRREGGGGAPPSIKKPRPPKAPKPYRESKSSHESKPRTPGDGPAPAPRDPEGDSPGLPPDAEPEN